MWAWNIAVKCLLLSDSRELSLKEDTSWDLDTGLSKVWWTHFIIYSLKCSKAHAGIKHWFLNSAVEMKPLSLTDYSKIQPRTNRQIKEWPRSQSIPKCTQKRTETILENLVCMCTIRASQLVKPFWHWMAQWRSSSSNTRADLQNDDHP